MTQPLDFQSVIMTLQKFWAEPGLPDLAALLHPGRRRDDEPGHLFARARSRTLECGLC